jgi:hypothetical protein
MMTDDNLGGPVSVPVKLWLGSWELITDALRNSNLSILATEIEDQVAEYLGG